MCGRYVTPEQAEMERLFHIGRRSNPNPFRQSYNVAPSMEVPVLHRSPQEEGYELSAARWTLVPHWWKQDKPPRFTHNCRIEEAADKPMWRDALRNSRCLIPAQGWYEWQEVERADPSTGELKPAKQPHFIYQPDRSLACFAGLLSWWQPPPGSKNADEPVLTCAVLTTEAAPSVAGVHERMPVVLDFHAYADWLEPSLRDASAALDVARSAMQTEFRHHAVSLRVNSKADDEALCEPAQ
jgi:putative SOS response-associated peptidase YedK